MRHFGEPQSELTKLGQEQLLSESPLSGLSLGAKERIAANMAKFVHDQLSPANLYDMPTVELNWGGESKPAQSRVEASMKEIGQAESTSPAPDKAKTLRSILPPFTAQGHKPYELIKGDDQPLVKPLNFMPESTGERMEKAAFQSSFAPPVTPQPAERPLTALPQVQQPEVHPLLALLKRPDNKQENQFPVASFKDRDTDIPRVFADFRPGAIDGKLGVRNDIPGKDPFSAPNCYQTFQINTAEGWSRTVTTLPDLSASRVETKFPDRINISYQDRLGRPERETVLDRQGNVLTETESRFDHLGSPTTPSYKRVKTANETIELTFDVKGNMLSKYTV